MELITWLLKTIRNPDALITLSGYPLALLALIVPRDNLTQATALYEIEWPYKDPEFRLKTVKGDYLGSIKRTPRRASSTAIRRLSLDLGMFRARPAGAKPPCSTTWA